MASVLSVVFLLFLGTVAASQSPNYWYFRCGNRSYAVGSHYEKSMKLVSTILTKRISSSPALFARGIAGFHRDERAYALAQCRQDAAASTCQRCLSKALQDVHLVCARRRSVVILYNRCTIQFSDRMLSWVFNDTMPTAFKLSYDTVQSQEFDMGVSTLMAGVASITANSSHRFATALEEIDTDANKYQAYGLAQCVPDMTPADCGECLKELLSVYNMTGHMGWTRATPWCSCQFEIYQFFRGDPVCRFPTLPNNTHKGDKRKKKIILIVLAVGVTATFSVLFLLSIFFLWRKRWSSQQKHRSAGEGPKNKDMETIEGPSEDHAADIASCPSAIACFDEITTNAQGKKIALFLDYDGTLSPIVKDPEKAFMSSDMRDTVRRAAELFPTSIVSGRSWRKVRDFVKLDELHYAGSHGMDIKMSDDVKIFRAGSEYEPMITQATESLVEATRCIIGANVENNVLCVSVHYRNVDEKEWELVENHVKDTLQYFPELILTRGHMVIELRPPTKWNKGDAVEYLLQRILQKLQLDVSQVLPIYIGDDLTDEDGFKVLRERNNGFGILVSQEPRSTKAFYSLKDPSEVMTFLGYLVAWRRVTPEVLSISSVCEDDDEIVETSSSFRSRI